MLRIIFVSFVFSLFAHIRSQFHCTHNPLGDVVSLALDASVLSVARITQKPLAHETRKLRLKLAKCHEPFLRMLAERQQKKFPKRVINQRWNLLSSTSRYLPRVALAEKREHKTFSCGNQLDFNRAPEREILSIKIKADGTIGKATIKLLLVAACATFLFSIFSAIVIQFFAQTRKFQLQFRLHNGLMKWASTLYRNVMRF